MTSSERVLARQFEIEARRHATPWLLMVEAAAAIVALLVLTARNPTELQEPIMGYLIITAAAACGATALWQLTTNPKRGWGIEAKTGDLLWWREFAGTRQYLGKISADNLRTARIVVQKFGVRCIVVEFVSGNGEHRCDAIFLPLEARTLLTTLEWL